MYIEFGVGVWRTLAPFVIIASILKPCHTVTDVDSPFSQGTQNGHDVGSKYRPNCDLDHDLTNADLDRCLPKGVRFVDKYLKHLRSKRHGDMEFDKCSEAVEFLSCMGPLLENCPAIKQTYRQWDLIYDVIHTSCNQSAEFNETSLWCFEEQFDGILAKRCDAYYRFNIAQRTRPRCHFEAENLHCKESLVRSACGDYVGDFAVYAFKLSARRKPRKRACAMSLNSQYDGFAYTEQCPATLSTTLNECRELHLEQTMLSFNADNDLVAEGRKNDIRTACRGYRDYKSCIRPLKKSCKQGINLILDYDGRLRTYLTKMEYICGDDRRDYMKQLPCYRNMLQKRALSRCDSTWNLLQPLLEKINAYEYYCRKHSVDSLRLQSVLDELRECYELAFIDSCGQVGGEVIGGLMRQVFQDPFYLRYRYKPDCSLHKPPLGPMLSDRPKDAYMLTYEKVDRAKEEETPKQPPASSLESVSYSSAIVTFDHHSKHFNIIFPTLILFLNFVILTR